MPGKRPQEPIAPATIPNQPLDPKVPDDEIGDDTEDERQARESEKAFDRAVNRTPPT